MQLQRMLPVSLSLSAPFHKYCHGFRISLNGSKGLSDSNREILAVKTLWGPSAAELSCFSIPVTS
jgi:hypothetical protein